MSENTILAKLQHKLGGPPEDEADVVYVLVEIRKYLDHVDPDPTARQYAVLRTYCDWAVHICLKGSGAEQLLRTLDDALATKGTEEERDLAMKTAFELFSLTQFRNELRIFLGSANLPLDLVDDHAWWGRFLKHYVGVVSDCPFVFRGTPSHGKSIRKVTLEINERTKSGERLAEGTANVVWLWKLELADGTALEKSHSEGYRLA
ncbi:MAG: hypothetical protein ACLP3K_15940 [Candidatus Acidiferrales bacterium]